MKKVLLLSLMSLLAVPAFAHNHEGGPDREALRAAFKECKEQSGAVKGEKPSKEVRKKVKACMEAKGFKKPEGMKKHRPHKAEFGSDHPEKE